MMWMVATLAVAEAADGPLVAAERVEWAQRFHLATPSMYRHTSTPRAVSDGWLVQLTVDPVYQRPHPIHTPVLWVNDRVAVRTNWRSACAVVWVPGDVDWSDARAYYASTELPERLSPAQGKAFSQQAHATMRPISTADVQPETLELPAMKELMALAQTRCPETTAR